jgi:Tfp pilus assembly protein PilP
MKTAMKLTGILALAMVVGGTAATTAVAQNTDAIDNARSIAKSLQQKQANDSNAALDAAGVTTAPQTTPATAKPAPGAPAPAVKPAMIPGSNPAPAAPAVSAKGAPASTSASSQHNQLQKVDVVQSADSIQVQISSSQAVTPRVSKLSSPARVVVELPETVVASSQNKIPVGNGGVKGVRIGMDGKTPPTTSVVVDLDKALAYEMTPGEDGKIVLTLHTQGGDAVLKTAADPGTKPAPAKEVAMKPATSGPQLKTMAANSAALTSKPTVTKTSATPAAVASTAVAIKVATKPAAKEVSTTSAGPFSAKPLSAKGDKSMAAAAGAPADDVSKIGDNAKQPKPEDKKWAMNGKRDPFFSPVVQQGGSGCSTGKKCLEIGNINLRGVVKSDSGFIAVVTNNLNKAYFLRENDPVFNGYVVKITGDSVVFQETVQDKLGKPFTREVVKRIFTPAV